MALEVAKGDFLLFTDADCAPSSNWIEDLISPFKRDPKIGATGGEVYTLKVDPNNLTEIYCEASRFNMSLLVMDLLVKVIFLISRISLPPRLLVTEPISLELVMLLIEERR